VPLMGVPKMVQDLGQSPPAESRETSNRDLRRQRMTDVSMAYARGFGLVGFGFLALATQIPILAQRCCLHVSEVSCCLSHRTFGTFS
jgi:hypothetical protein